VCAIGAADRQQQQQLQDIGQIEIFDRDKEENVPATTAQYALDVRVRSGVARGD
jgi:hypothetical protein